MLFYAVICYHTAVSTLISERDADGVAQGQVGNSRQGCARVHKGAQQWTSVSKGRLEQAKEG